jgi:hypothetical protein
MKKLQGFSIVVLLSLLSACGAQSVSTIEELKSYCLGVSVDQMVSMEFQDYELDLLASGLKSGSPIDEILRGYKSDSLDAINKYRELKDEGNFIYLAESLTNFNNRCADLIG